MALAQLVHSGSINVGVVGYGYWGPNVVRNFFQSEKVNPLWLCDMSEASLKKAGKVYPAVSLTQDYRDVVRDPAVDAVAVITPVFTHYEIAREALLNGKHVFIEKPFTANSDQAMELIEIAEKNQLVLMVDHTFLFTGAVRHMRRLIDKNELGDMLYYDSTRVNLGMFQHDINVIWDLAPHDFSIMDYLIDKPILSVSAIGADHYNNGMEDVAYVTVRFEDNLIAHFNFNWISPVKIRQTLIGGQQKMLVWNDLETDEKIKIYDKGINVLNRESIYKLLVQYRTGDMHSPKLDNIEALTMEIDYFIECVENRTTPINDGRAGLRVVKLLEACDRSMRQGGKMIDVSCGTRLQQPLQGQPAGR